MSWYPPQGSCPIDKPRALNFCHPLSDIDIVHSFISLTYSRTQAHKRSHTHSYTFTHTLTPPLTHMGSYTCWQTDRQTDRQRQRKTLFVTRKILLIAWNLLCPFVKKKKCSGLNIMRIEHFVYIVLCAIQIKTIIIMETIHVKCLFRNSLPKWFTLNYFPN